MLVQSSKFAGIGLFQRRLCRPLVCWLYMLWAEFYFDRTSEAQAAIDARNARYKSASERESQKARKDGSEGDSRELKERLSSAEKAVEKFVAQRIQPAVRKVPLFPSLSSSFSKCVISFLSLCVSLYLRLQPTSYFNLLTKLRPNCFCIRQKTRCCNGHIFEQAWYYTGSVSSTFRTKSSHVSCVNPYAILTLLDWHQRPSKACSSWRWQIPQWTTVASK